MVTIPNYRSDQARIQVSVGGIPIDNVPWDSFSGGDNVATDVNYNPAGGQSINMGGIARRSDITVDRIWSDTLINAYGLLDQGVGVVPVSVSVTTTDANYQATGRTTTYTGILKGATRPAYDSSTSTEARLQLVIGVNGSITHS